MPGPSPLPIEPLSAAVHGIGKYRTMHSVADLAHALMNYWPDVYKGNAWRNAVSACLEALEAQSGGDAAREAFIAAAVESGISVMPYQPPPPKPTAPKGKRR